MARNWFKFQRMCTVIKYWIVKQNFHKIENISIAAVTRLNIGMCASWCAWLLSLPLFPCGKYVNVWILLNEWEFEDYVYNKHVCQWRFICAKVTECMHEALWISTHTCEYLFVCEVTIYAYAWASIFMCVYPKICRCEYVYPS